MSQPVPCPLPRHSQLKREANRSHLPSAPDTPVLDAYMGASAEGIDLMLAEYYKSALLPPAALSTGESPEPFGHALSATSSFSDDAAAGTPSIDAYITALPPLPDHPSAEDIAAAGNLGDPEEEAGRRAKNPNAAERALRRRQADRTDLWLREHFEAAGLNLSVQRDRFYALYVLYARRRAYRVQNQATFGKMLRAVFPGVCTRRLGTRASSKYHYAGVAIRPSSPFWSVALDIMHDDRNFRPDDLHMFRGSISSAIPTPSLPHPGMEMVQQQQYATFPQYTPASVSPPQEAIRFAAPCTLAQEGPATASLVEGLLREYEAQAGVLLTIAAAHAYPSVPALVAAFWRTAARHLGPVLASPAAWEDLANADSTLALHLSRLPGEGGLAVLASADALLVAPAHPWLPAGLLEAKRRAFAPWTDAVKPISGPQVPPSQPQPDLVQQYADISSIMLSSGGQEQYPAPAEGLAIQNLSGASWSEQEHLFDGLSCVF